MRIGRRRQPTRTWLSWKQPPEEPGHPGGEDERGRLLEAAHDKAKQGSRKLRWWRARLTPEQIAIIGDWSGLEESAKAADK